MGPAFHLRGQQPLTLRNRYTRASAGPWLWRRLSRTFPRLFSKHVLGTQQCYVGKQHSQEMADPGPRCL